MADEYGIEVPENLNRLFLIAELLEIAEENKLYSDKDEMVISAVSEDGNGENTLPESYNETQISCVLRNPVWAFVFWNISDSDALLLKNLNEYSLLLRVCSLPSKEEMTPLETFEVTVSEGSREQYILLPSGQKFLRLELVYISDDHRKVLAFSPVIEVPQTPEFINEFTPGKEMDFPEILKLSGINKILTDQYKNHRHSFS
ncbi:MAG: DUF4912 domain-containing protein [Treponema sp.]|nr:DUF4912 domain-containing protein [Treponema sp.]